MRVLEIIYLDPNLISLAYEELEGASPATMVSQSCDVSGGLNVGLIKVGSGSTETREYEQSTYQMFFRLETKLHQLQRLAPENALAARNAFWVSGFLAYGERRITENAGRVLKEHFHFSINQDTDDRSTDVHLATHDQYFSSGYDEVAAHKDMLCEYLWEPVDALLRPLLSNPHTKSFLFAPLVIVRGQECVNNH
jgi:hypothetical protein